MSGIPFNPSGAPQLNANINLPFGYSGGPQGVGGLGGLNNLGVTTTSRPNSYVGLNNFVSVMAHYVSVANVNQNDDGLSMQDSRDLGLGMLVFARDKDKIAPTRQHKPLYNVAIGVDLSKNTVEFKELTQLNVWLEKHSHYYKRPSEIIAEWRLLGVVKTEAAPTYAPTYGSAAASRILNLVTGHRVSVLNYWSSCRILQTQKLFLLVNRNAGGKWQIIPWSSPDLDHPSLADVTMKWGPDNQNESIGDCYYVGKSSDQHWAHTSSTKTATTNAEVIKSLVKRGMMSSIEIYLGI